MELVCNLSCLRCSAGSTGNQILCDRNVKVLGESVATVNDAVPIVNIQSFGICAITRMPCVPATSRWEQGDPTVKVNGHDVICKSATLRCAVGGIITVTDVVKSGVTIG